MTVPRDAVVIIQGQPKAWILKADSGREVKNLFCGDCGSPLFHERTYSPNTINGTPKNKLPKNCRVGIALGAWLR